jgi:hypothetical protein
MATATETDKMAALATAANEARGLAMDSIAAAHSGHMGLPLGAAEIGAILYGSQVRFVEIIINICIALWKLAILVSIVSPFFIFTFTPNIDDLPRR